MQLGRVLVKERDVFLCHASADKDTYVRPFAAALAANGITYWIDEAEISWGDRITEKINEGLARSPHVVVFLTEAFLKRHWPQAELGSALSLEASTGGVVVLPILAAPAADVFAQYPLLRDKLFLRWQDGIEFIVAALAKRLGIEFKPHWSFCHPASYWGQVWIQVVPRPENRTMVHRYVVGWGDWVCDDVLDLEGLASATLVHAKCNDGLSVPLLFDVTPPCYVVFGQGDPPAEPVYDINDRWTRVDGA
jgi:hypothetical protein